MHIPTPTPWRELSQAQLDWAYDQTQHAPNLNEVLQACATHSQGVQAGLQASGLHQRHAYGEHPDEALDWYRSPQPSGVLVAKIHISSECAGTALWTNSVLFFVSIPAAI